MIYVSGLHCQSDKTEFSYDDLSIFSTDEDVKALCEKYRETNDVEDKKKLFVLLTSGNHFFVDIDGANHISGNQEIDINKVLSLIPHVASYTSPSGKGLKLLVETNRDCLPHERATVRKHILDQVKIKTGIIVDHCRTDIAFVSDYPVKFSNQLFPIPDKFKTYVRTDFTDSRKSSGDNFSPLDDLNKLEELLDNCPIHTDYNTWLAIVLSVLRLYGESAIPLLEGKWKSKVPYSTLQMYAYKCDTGILDKIWNGRIRKNFSPASKQYSRRIITGATGAGKSQFAINEMKKLFSEYDSEYHNYVIYIVPSIDQAIDFSRKLDNVKISYEILVGPASYAKLDDSYKSKVVVKSMNNSAVKIIQLEALKKNSYYKHISYDRRKLCHMYIDELTFTDFVRPSILSTDLVRSYSGIKTNDDIKSIYHMNYSRSDYEYALNLSVVNSDSHFISSILYQHVNTTVLTTEELTTTCLEGLNFEKITIKQKETEELSDTCSLHVSESPYYVLPYIESDTAKQQIKDMKFDNVFANKCEFATGNLMTIKGKHLTGKNLSIIRCLPREATSTIEYLFRGCFRSLENVNPVALFYKDSLMQAVGRSIGFRGEAEAWVMIHSSIWSMIKDTEWIYKIKDWNVEIDQDLMKSIDEARSHKSSLLRDAYAEKVQFMKNEKAARIKSVLILTGNPKDTLRSKDVKNIFGAGYTLKDIVDAFNLILKRDKKSIYVVGVKHV